MRTVSAATITAIETPVTYSLRSRMTIQKSRVFFETVDEDHHPNFADSDGWINNAIPEEMCFPSSGSNPVTFYNHGGIIKYTTYADSDGIEVGTYYGIVGRPGVAGSRLFKADNSNVYYDTINWSNIALHSQTPFDAQVLVDTPTTGSGSCCAISETEFVYMMVDEGGIRPVYYEYSGGTWNDHSFPLRFMFPSKIEAGVSGVSITQMTNYSGAAKFGDKIFIYQSNLLAGTVEGCYYDTVANDWSDIFTAVPTDLAVSLCEFRVSRCYVVDDRIYISGQFRRSEPSTPTQPYTLILASVDGKTFSINRFALVSTMGYRFQALVKNDYLFIGHCNRIARLPVSQYFSPTSGSAGYSYEIYQNPDIIRVSDSNGESASFSIAAGNNVAIDSGYLQEGNRVIYEVGYLTTGSIPDFTQYGIYIIDTYDLEFADGVQAAEINCVNESIWHLTGLTSPFYTEIISKSSLYTNNTDSSYWSEAENSGLGENSFSADFWTGTGYTSGSDVSAAVYSFDGGLEDFYSSGSHKIGFQTDDLDVFLGSSEPPKVSSGSVHVKIYGWSFNDEPPRGEHQDGTPSSLNDTITCRLLMNTSGSDPTEYYLEQTGQRFPNTWPEGYTASGSYPVEYDFTGVTVGDFIKRVVLIFECAEATSFYPQRVDVTSGVSVAYPYKSGAQWDFTSGSGAELPGKLRPFIMNATRPFNAWNFQAAASYTNTVSMLTNFEASCGIAGLIYDGSNYVVGKYDRTSQKVIISKVRDRVETQLTQGDPTFMVGTTFDIMFTHRDGNFTVYLKNNNEWVQQLTYSWKESDGWMLKDTIASTDVGIYGYIDTPYFRMVGYDKGGDEDVNNAEGFAVLPGYSEFDFFPTAGSYSGSLAVDVDDNTYLYTNKIAVTDIRGPSQFRNNATWSEPYGHGDALECLDHDWSRPPSYLTGKFAAIDDGGVYAIRETFWQPWITTSGVVIDLPGRARYYGSGRISAAVHSLGNKVYATGGLSGITLSKGEYSTHAYGSEVFFHAEGTIFCNWFYGASGDYDATVRDLIDHISKISGAGSDFLGDKTIASQVVNGTYTTGSLAYTEGFDLYFTADLSAGDWMEVECYGKVTSSAQSIYIECTTGNSYKVKYINTSGSPADAYPFELAGAGRYRVLFHDDFATVYANDRWICTFCPESIAYDTAMDINLVTGQSTTITDICLSELCDWREAVYIDFETDSKSAIGSVIQERPVEVYAQPNGHLSYWYEPQRQTISQVADHIRLHHATKTIPKNSSSDGIIYYANVATISNANYARDYGFTTRVYRMPSLTSGAIKAARITQQREYESGYMHQIKVRSDIRLQSGDILAVSYTAAGSGRSYNFSIILTDVTLSIAGENAESSMQISGRSI